MSTSGPHGYSIGKFFNQIGWLEVDAVGKRKLNFKVIKNRIGGGTPGGSEDPRTLYRFATLFGKPEPGPSEPQENPWLVEMTADEFKAAAAAKYANAPKLTAGGVKTAQSAPPSPVAVLTPTPKDAPTPPSPEAPKPKLTLAALQGLKKS